MEDLKDLTALANQDVTLGGIVTDLRKGYTKKGNPFGIAKIEDYSGAGEIPLFGQDWIDWGNHMQQGYFLFIHGKVQPKQWKPDEFELKINKIELLPDIKDEKIERITLSIGLDNLDEAMFTELSTLIKENPGKAELHFLIKDQETLSQSSLYSKNTKVHVGKKLVNYLKSNPAIEFKINK